LFYLIVLLLVMLDRLAPRLRPLWLRAEGWATRYRWGWVGVLVVLLAGYIAYNYAVAPWLPNVRFDKAGNPIQQGVVITWDSYIGAPVDQGPKYNLLRIGWYLSPLGIAVGGLGLLRLVWGKLNAATGLFFGSLLVVGFLFIQETYTEAHYIYTMRRYVPLILPAFVMGMAWVCQLLWSRLRPRPFGLAAAAVLAVGIGVFFIYTSRVVLPHIEEQGAISQLSTLAARFPPNSVVLFSNERDEPNVVSTPLQFVYGIESFVVNRGYPQVSNDILQGVVQRWQSQGYKVWVMMGANGGKLHFPNLSLRPEGSWSYDGPEFEQLYFQKPTNVSSAYLPWGIYSVQPASPPPVWPFKIDIGDMDYEWLVAGFNKQERDRPGTPYWRWTGDQAVLRLPWPAAPGGKNLSVARLTLRLRPETPVEGKKPFRTQPLTVGFSIGDTPIGQVVVQSGTDFTDYILNVPAVPAPQGGEPGYALLQIKSPTWSPEQAGVSYDTRILGIQVESVEIASPAPAP
jgi:hypothetical protein